MVVGIDKCMPWVSVRHAHGDNVKATIVKEKKIKRKKENTCLLYM